MPATQPTLAGGYEALRDQLVAEHRPATPTESILVDQLAFAAFRMRLIQQNPDASDAVKAYRAAEQLFHRALRALGQFRRHAPKPRPPADGPPANVIPIDRIQLVRGKPRPQKKSVSPPAIEPAALSRRAAVSLPAIE